MKKFNDAELNQKIDAFMSRKLAQHPDLQQPDGVRAGRLWHVDARLKEVWHVLGGSGHRHARQH